MRVLSDGRVRRTEAEWCDLVERFEQSGLSEVEFCRRSKLSRQSLRTWRTRFAAEKPARAQRRSKATKADFVEWVAPTTDTGTKEQTAGEFELTFPGGVVLRWKV